MKKRNLIYFITLIVSTLIICSCNSTKNIQKMDSIKFNPNNYTTRILTVEGKSFSVKCYENIVYVSNPVDTNYQIMNIYIPEDAKDNSPIFFPNQVGGYMPGKPGTPNDGTNKVPGDFRQGDSGPNAIAVALSKGMTVASPGARGRTEKYGHAPACIVDLKAAVRYLRHNKNLITGDTEKIISNGTSAGGALSVLLGASGNSKDYEKYLKEIGAANERDDIFAVSAYCPITNLENANAAYEWMFNGINDYQKMDISMIDFHIERKLVKGSLTDEEIKISAEMKDLFPAYVNSLNLVDSEGKKLSLDKDGHGSFENYIKSLIVQSAQTALDEGTDLSDKQWISVENGKVTDLNFEAYKKYLGRQKLPGAFDSLNNDTGENNLFGDDEDNFKHFTDYAMEKSKVDASMADSELVKIMNVMNYADGEKSSVSHNWRIRAGTKDADTAACISAMLALKLEQNGKNVDYCLPWDVGHRGDYDLPQLFSWIEDICIF